ncbi:hypothetical protein E7T06_18560 [Deinococcus sp. Arct2-2]|uniref:hypothetical protein n=1 Tax=Deinococcus sp. Arct2-2 TaxID=2568653 RepID=UPI0010A2DEE5|nr:hypothetical protein [Deinococcus sp. Arct2-2]THF67956.1 hypothetical protein E7T06_18560 [Deinococcus sp. Arct2-2]
MKPIGPYVAARELPGRDVAGTVVGPLIGPATVRTLRATDRLTGMPVLVHVLPSALPVPQLPDHPALLPYSDEGMDGDDAYLVTELPLHAVLAADPVLAARGALAGLAALHGAGLVHGGVSASQLWSVDGRVALAGAGLPWSAEAGSPEDDLRALADALAALGGVPQSVRALKDSPGTLTAQAALAQLQASAGAGSSASANAAPSPVQTSALEVEVKPAEAATPPTPPTPLHDGTPIILGESWPDPADANTSAATTAAPHPSGPDAPWGKVELAVVDVAFTHLPEVPARVADPVTAEDVRANSEPRSAAEPAVQSPSQQVLSQADAKQPEPGQADLSAPAVIQIDLTQPGAAQPSAAQPNTVQPSTDAPDAAVTITAVRPPIQPEPSTLPAVSPVSAYSNAPPGVAETPQERRKRQNDERRAQAMQDSRAAAERKAAARREQEAAQPAVVQIDFDDLPELPPADSEAPQTVGMRFPASVNVERVPASMRRAPLLPERADQEGSEQPDQRAAQEVGRLPARRTQGEPIRIGWAEDDSWRVVKAPGKTAPARRAATAPRWLLPLLAALLLIGGAVWAYLALPAAKTPAASGPCCTVRFTVQGAAGVTARLTVLDAPAAANLTPGQELGVAPGPIDLPVRGTYRLRVAADGYAPGTLSVTAPTSQPVRIDLGP